MYVFSVYASDGCNTKAIAAPTKAGAVKGQKLEKRILYLCMYCRLNYSFEPCIVVSQALFE